MVKSFYFDADYYLSRNPDVAAAGVDAYWHFMVQGWKENRDPSVFFNTQYYFKHNPDVAAAAINPLLHFMQQGITEGRDPSAFFDTSYYLLKNPDVLAAGVNPFEHFLEQGWREGRAAGTLFNTGYYLEHNPDVVAAGVNPFEHWLQQGIIEKRNPNATFNIAQAAHQNQHLMEAILNVDRPTARNEILNILTGSNSLSGSYGGNGGGGAPAYSAAPVLTGLDSITFLENTVNATAQVIDSSITLADTDSAHFAGGKLTIAYSLGGGAEDRLSIRHQGNGVGQIGVTGNDIRYGGVVIGSIVAGKNGLTGAELQILLNLDATPIATKALIENLTYANSSNTPAATRTISITVSDGIATSAAATAVITVTPEDEPQTFVFTNGIDNFVGGNADDTFIVNDANHILQADTAVGNGGTDTVRFNSSGGHTAFLSNFSSIEHLVLAGTGTYDIDFLGTVDYDVTGSAQSDTFNFYGNGTYDPYANGKLAPLLSGSHTINGGAGADTLYWWPDAVTSFSDSMLQNKTSIETIKMDPGAGFTVNLSTHASALAVSNTANTLTIDVQTSQTLTVSANAIGAAIFKLTDTSDNSVRVTLADGVNNKITITDGNTSSVAGGDGADSITGGNLADTLAGGAGDDVIYGGDGNDRLNGAAGADYIDGGNGDDVIFSGVAGAQRDTIIGGMGNDSINELAGTSILIFRDSSGVDTISQFSNPGAAAGSMIHILSNVNGSGIINWATLAPHISQAGMNTLIDLTGGHTITLNNITAANLTADDFVFF